MDLAIKIGLGFLYICFLSGIAVVGRAKEWAWWKIIFVIIVFSVVIGFLSNNTGEESQYLDSLRGGI